MSAAKRSWLFLHCNLFHFSFMHALPPWCSHACDKLQDRSCHMAGVIAQQKSDWKHQMWQFQIFLFHVHARTRAETGTVGHRIRFDAHIKFIFLSCCCMHFSSSLCMRHLFSCESNLCRTSGAFASKFCFCSVHMSPNVNKQTKPCNSTILNHTATVDHLSNPGQNAKFTLQQTAVNYSPPPTHVHPSFKF